MARINSYPRSTDYSTDDVILMDGATNGTRTILASTLGQIYRSKIGDTYQEQVSASDRIIARTSAGQLVRVTPEALKSTMGLANVEPTTAITNAEIDQIFENVVNGTTNS